MQQSKEVEEIIEEQKKDLTFLINNMKDVDLIDEKITCEEFLTIDSKHVIIHDIVPQELLNTKLRELSQNFKFSGFEKKDAKKT